jgi:voltage-gated potassium channel
VVRNNFHKLRLAGWVTAVFWIVFSALLCVCESSHRVVTGDNGIAQSNRFGDMLVSMPYTLILLSGDYPLVDFTPSGQMVCLCMCVFAVGLVSVPSGIIAQGFQTEALRERERRGIKDEAEVEEVVSKPAYLGDGSLASRVQSLLSPDDDNGQWFDRFIAALIIASVAAVVAESEPGVRAAVPPACFDWFEAGCAAVFTVEYGLRLYSSPYDRRSDYSRAGYIKSFFGTADLLALLPFYLELGFARFGVAYDPAWLGVLRLLRILQLEHFTEAFTLLDDVFRACRNTLVATSFLAIIIWVFSSYLFYVLERGNPAVGDAFDSLPNAMYYTAIFLSGEWGHTDFTPAGKVLCCFLVVVGLGLYAMPVAAFFDAFGEVLAKGDDKAGVGGGVGSDDDGDGDGDAYCNMRKRRILGNS